MALLLGEHFLRRSFHTPAPVPGMTDGRNPSGPSGEQLALREVLKHGDARALQAVGFTPEEARAQVVGRAYGRMRDRLLEIQAGLHPNQFYWRHPDNQARKILQQQNREKQASQREFADVLRAEYGVLAEPDPGNECLTIPSLSMYKQQQLGRIEADYTELQSQMTVSTVLLPSDTEKLKRLLEEKTRDLTALLTPAEYEKY